MAKPAGAGSYGSMESGDSESLLANSLAVTQETGQVGESTLLKMQAQRGKTRGVERCFLFAVGNSCARARDSTPPSRTPPIDRTQKN